MVKAVREEEVHGTTGDRICETGRFSAEGETERELWMSRVVKQKRKK